MAEISLAPMERIIKNAGAKRVSEGAKEKLRDIAEEYASGIAERANLLARHANRKTVKKADIILAFKQ